MTIDALNPLVPADNIAVAGVPDAIRDIVVALQASFPDLVGAIGLAVPTTLSPTWVTISAAVAKIQKSWDGVVQFALTATYAASITTSPSSINISNIDMTGWMPLEDVAETEPVLPVWGLNGSQWMECGYLKFTTTGIIFTKVASSSFGITKIRVCGCYGVL